MIARALLCGTALSLAASYAAACDNPPLAQVPTAGEAGNLAGQIQQIFDDVQEYRAAMEEFTACLQAEIESARDGNAPDLVQNLLVQRNNSAVAEVEAVVTQFNQLVETVNSGQAEQIDQ